MKIKSIHGLWRKCAACGKLIDTHCIDPQCPRGKWLEIFFNRESSK